jgi:L-2-amino-thiazoline-4-carboxylic acid hydrolase-like protein
MPVNNEDNSSSEQNRRKFFSTILPLGAMCGFGCKTCFASDKSEKKHKFLENSGMSFEEVFNFAFKNFYIPIMKNLSNEIGKDEFIETLKKARAELGKQEGQNLAKGLGKNDMASLAAFVKDSALYNSVLKYEIVEETDQAFEMNVTECLWAKTFREADASDIGYAGLCYGDYALTSAFNPKMKLIRPKTLMDGDVCNLRHVLEA